MTVTAEQREQYIQNNMGLVHSCARRFRNRGIEYDDLVSSGYLGLVKAVDGFEEERGLCFSTYAVPVILGEIKKLFRDGGAVKVSRSVKELGIKITALREKALKQGRPEPTVCELAQQLNVSPQQVALAIKASQPALSLTPEEDGGGQLDVPVESGEESLAERLSLRAELEALPDQDRLLLVLRFYRGLTQTQTARLLGTTQVQVSRRERRLLGWMRARLSE